MRTKIKVKGECWEQSPIGKVRCIVCGSKSLIIEFEIDDETQHQTYFISCSCGAEYEVGMDPKP